MKDYSKLSSAGGKVTAIKFRKIAIDEYYKNPNFCKKCQNIINVNGRERVCQVKKKKFCSRSCSASYNNQIRDSLRVETIVKSKKIESKVKFEMDGKNIEKVFLSEMTKDEIFSRFKTYQAARNYICKNAIKVYKDSGKKRLCIKCGYFLITDIAHRKPVSDFTGDTKIKEINHIDNLMAMCKNHHWEFDHGFLEI
jgi:hypothetical protein